MENNQIQDNNIVGIELADAQMEAVSGGTTSTTRASRRASRAVRQGASSTTSQVTALGFYMMSGGGYNPFIEPPIGIDTTGDTTAEYVVGYGYGYGYGFPQAQIVAVQNGNWVPIPNNVD